MDRAFQLVGPWPYLRPGPALIQLVTGPEGGSIGQRDATLPGWRFSPNNFPRDRSIARVVSWIACWTERPCGLSALGRARRLLSDLRTSVTVTAGRAAPCGRDDASAVPGVTTTGVPTLTR